MSHEPDKNLGLRPLAPPYFKILVRTVHIRMYMCVSCSTAIMHTQLSMRVQYIVHYHACVTEAVCIPLVHIRMYVTPTYVPAVVLRRVCFACLLHLLPMALYLCMLRCPSMAFYRIEGS